MNNLLLSQIPPLSPFSHKKIIFQFTSTYVHWNLQNMTLWKKDTSVYVPCTNPYIGSTFVLLKEDNRSAVDGMIRPNVAVV